MLWSAVTAATLAHVQHRDGWLSPALSEFLDFGARGHRPTSHGSCHTRKASRLAQTRPPPSIRTHWRLMPSGKLPGRSAQYAPVGQAAVDRDVECRQSVAVSLGSDQG